MEGFITRVYYCPELQELPHPVEQTACLPWLWMSLSTTRNGCEATWLLDLEIAPGLKVQGHVKAPSGLDWPSHSSGGLKFLEHGGVSPNRIFRHSRHDLLLSQTR